MACPSPEQLVACAAGVGEADMRAEIEAHASDCATCARALADACDDRLLDEVREVVDAERRSVPAPRAEPERELAGYRLVRKLGEGGMGVVYEAEQRSPRRMVALKIVRGSLTSERTTRRFELEAEVLGRLQHPGIAQIHESGTFTTEHGTQPFFAMELVRGASLLDYVERGGLDVAARLQLVARICDAVHHAHQKGVVHRDLKPSNILVGEDDQPKVLDFGVARVLRDGDGGGGGTLMTMPGQIVGTLQYMSPEQLGGAMDDVDVRTDVYALGVILCEVLTGRLPYGTEGRSVAEWARIIAEAEPKPLGAFDRRLRGDVETIARTALMRDPGRRYQSAAELAADLRRFLAHEPIAARAPSAAYLAGRFARRHRTLVGAAAAVTVALIGGAGVSLWQLARARAEAATATAVEDYLAEFLSFADLERDEPPGPDLTVRDALDAAAKRIDRLAGQPEAEVRVRAMVGKAYRGLASYDAAAEHLTRAAELSERHYGPAARELADVLNELAIVESHRNNLAEAEAFHRRVVAIRERDQGAESGAVALALNNLASVLHRRGAQAEATAAADRAMAIARARDDALLPAFATQRAIIAKAAGEPDLALALLQEAIGVWEQRGARHPSFAYARGQLAELLRERGDHDGAELQMRAAVDLLHEVLGPEHPNTRGARAWLERLREGR